MTRISTAKKWNYAWRCCQSEFHLMDHNALLTIIRYPRTKLSTKFQDSHVYVCRRSVLDVLQQKPHMDSLREEFFPWLCRIQYQRTKRNKYDRSEYMNWSDRPFQHLSTMGQFLALLLPHCLNLRLCDIPLYSQSPTNIRVPLSRLPHRHILAAWHFQPPRQ